MKKIYLLSGPDKNGFSKEISKSLKNDLKKCESIAFIASSPKDHEKNKKYVYGDKEIVGMLNYLKNIKKFSNTSIIDESITIEESKEIIEKADVIYLLGGNYKTQLNFIKKRGYDKLLKSFSGILLCTSCGAMNLAKYGYYSKDEDSENSFFYDGLNLVDISIDPHFNCNNLVQIEEDKKMSKIHKIYGVPNDSAIVINNKEYLFIGNIFIFENGNISVGDKL